MTPAPSFGLASKHLLTAAAIRLGYVSRDHKDDLEHPDVLAAQRYFEDCDERLTRWIVAVERVMDTETNLVLRAGDPSKVVVLREDVPGGERSERMEG